MSAPVIIQPALKKAQEEAQAKDVNRSSSREQRKEQFQQKFKEQGDQLKKAQEEMAAAAENVKSLEGRVKELEQIHDAMSLQLREAQETNDALNRKVGQQAHLLLDILKFKNQKTKERAEALNSKIEALSVIVLGGNRPSDDFYELLDKFIVEQTQQQETTLQLLEANGQAFATEVQLRKELCDNRNGVLINNQQIARQFNYIRDLKGIPEEIRKITDDLKDVQATLAILSATDFNTADKNSLEEIKLKFSIQLGKLNTTSNDFDVITRGNNARDLIARVNKTADTSLTPITDSELEGYEFYTTAGKEAVSAQLNALAKADQDKYLELRKLISEQWNKIVQQISQLYCESDLLSHTLNFQIPLKEHHQKLAQLYIDLRETRKGTPASPNADNINSLKQTLVSAKGRFLEALELQKSLSEEYKTQIQLRTSEEVQKTLADRIKDELAQIDKQAESNSSLKNKATPEVEVEKQLTLMHKELHRKYEDFMTKINNLWSLIEKQGAAAAIELMRLEDAIASEGVFTTEIYYTAIKRGASVVGLGQVPPYEYYWSNPVEGIAKMTAAPTPTTDALPQAV